MLWRERDLLGAVVSVLVEPRAESPGRLPAARPVAEALAALDEVQCRRRLGVDRAGVALGLPAGCTLADLAAAAPRPWDDLLRRHIVGLLEATSEVVAAADMSGSDGETGAGQGGVGLA